jgi:GT2 family glycosyltransferase
MGPDASSAVGIAVVTRDRRERLLDTLGRLRALPQRPPVAVVDNASSDGTAEAVRERFPDVLVQRLQANAGAAARTVAARLLATPVVAFADDDSWWADDALDVIVSAFAAHERLGLLAARVLVGRREDLDPTCEEMAENRLGDDAPPGPRVLGFVACGAAVRRRAFLEVGGFEQRLGTGGEESLLSIDLAAAGWELRYVPRAIAHHHPDAADPRPDRETDTLRNALWVLWLRRRAPTVIAQTIQALARSGSDPTIRRALIAALREAPWALRNRRVVPSRIERELRLLEA